MNDYVFESVSQALHFAGVMEMMPATTMSPTWLVIRALQEQAGDVWGHAKPETTMNLRGMSPLELRAQCALVVGAVNHHCPGPERNAIWVHYGFERLCIDAALSLAPYLASGSRMKQEIVTALVLSIAVPRSNVIDRRRSGEREGLTAADVAVQYEIRKQDAYAEKRRLARLCHCLRENGERRLGELFERTGLVQAAETA